MFAFPITNIGLWINRTLVRTYFVYYQLFFFLFPLGIRTIYNRVSLYLYLTDTSALTIFFSSQGSRSLYEWPPHIGQFEHHLVLFLARKMWSKKNFSVWKIFKVELSDRHFSSVLFLVSVPHWWDNETVARIHVCCESLLSTKCYSLSLILQLEKLISTWTVEKPAVLKVVQRKSLSSSKCWWEVYKDELNTKNSPRSTKLA